MWFAVSRATPTTAKTTAHTAVVEIKGEIANGADASAEFVIAAMKAAGTVAVLLPGAYYTLRDTHIPPIAQAARTCAMGGRCVSRRAP